MTEWIGKVHDYLGMRIDYTAPGKVKISQVDYLQEVLAELPKDMDGVANTPAAAHLFDVNDKPDPLSPDEADFFHSNVAKLLFACQRSRPDIQTAVAFLSSRVQAPDRDDYKKLRRVMQYIRGSLDQVRTMEADGTGLAKWWIDASFAVHPDMRGHTGGVLSLGKGATYTASRGQKINTRSSTESELVGVYDILPQVLWTRNFLEAQGYGIKDSMVYQDNKSTMLLAENGRASSSKRTRHINIRYFFVTDLIKSGQIRIEHCPTQEMVSDYFTKPLQGAAFRKLRRLIMNTEEDVRDLTATRRSVLEQEIRDSSANHGQVPLRHLTKDLDKAEGPSMNTWPAKGRVSKGDARITAGDNLCGQEGAK
jgi:hypothetical protein